MFLKTNYFHRVCFLLFQKDELEVELLKLKHYGTEDKADPVGGSSSSLGDTSRGKT
jgi:hypothetical protein